MTVIDDIRSGTKVQSMREDFGKLIRPVEDGKSYPSDEIPGMGREVRLCPKRVKERLCEEWWKG